MQKPFFLDPKESNKKNTKSKGSPRETTQIQVTVVDLLVFFFSCHVLFYFPVVILVTLCFGVETTSTLTPGLVLLKATPNRKSTL